MAETVPDIGRNSLQEREAAVLTLRPALAPSAASAPLSAAAWRRLLILLGGACALLLLVFWRTAWSIVETWYSSRTFSHGFLILPVFVYLAWLRRERLAALRPRPNYWVLPLLFLLSCVWLGASLGDVHVAQQFAVVAMIDALFWLALGTGAMRALWFPLAFLFFAVPFGEAAIGPLQDFTAHFAVAALGLSHVPAILENRTIWVPSGPWIVAEACSGIRYLISSLVLGLIYASLVYRSRRRRVIFVVASLAVPIVANGIRAYGIILLAYLTNNRLAVGVDHIIYGWIFFTAVQLLLFSIGMRWREAPAEASPVTVPPGDGGTAAGRLLQKIAIACAVALAIVSLPPLAEAGLARRQAAAPPVRFLAVVNSPWQQLPSFDQRWAPQLHAQSQFAAAYAAGDSRVDLHLAAYSRRERLELVSGYNRVSDHKLWSDFEGGYRPLVIAGQPVNVRWDVLRSESGFRLVWTWYSVQGKLTADPLQVKLFQAKARLLGQPASAAVISLSSGYVLQPAEAEARMEDFLRHAAIVPAARENR